MISRTTLCIAATLTLALAGPAAAQTYRHSYHHYHHTMSRGGGGGNWDGVWSGAWGGQQPFTITISGSRVRSFTFNGSSYPVRSSRVSARAVSYGDKDASVYMTRTGANSAHAHLHSSQGEGDSEARRQ